MGINEIAKRYKTKEKIEVLAQNLVKLFKKEIPFEKFKELYPDMNLEDRELLLIPLAIVKSNLYRLDTNLQYEILRINELELLSR
jgi:hypothetical protein